MLSAETGERERAELAACKALWSKCVADALVAKLRMEGEAHGVDVVTWLMRDKRHGRIGTSALHNSGLPARPLTCKLLIRRHGEMSEWLKEHAWKSDLFTLADAHQIPPTHSRSTTSRNIGTRRHVLLNHRVDRGFKGVCDTVLTQHS